MLAASPVFCARIAMARRRAKAGWRIGRVRRRMPMGGLCADGRQPVVRRNDTADTRELVDPAGNTGISLSTSPAANGRQCVSPGRSPGGPATTRPGPWFEGTPYVRPGQRSVTLAVSELR